MISIRPRGVDTLGTKTEVKNLNSFSSAERAVEVEFARQRALLESGGRVEQQTLLYDEKRNQVRSARSKEGSHDYRYFPEPDLPPLHLTDAFVQVQREALPELPAAKRVRFAAQYGLPPADIDQLIVNRTLADRFEAVASLSGEARRAANWMLGPVLASVNASGGMLLEHAVSPARLGALIQLEAKGEISNTAARQIFTLMEREPTEPMAIATRDGLLKVTDDSALVAWIDEVFAESPTEAARFMAGERKLQGVLVGQVMKKSNGSADPKKVNQLLAARAE